jgi:peptidoglycan/LPS O-acetylase OafA/YrhL
MSNQPSSSKKEYFYFLDALRGIAAVWVVLFHSHTPERLTSLYQALPIWVSVPVFAWGDLGVAIFFVLSGFVIAYSLRDALIDPYFFQRFSLRRLVRLAPPYYVSIVLTVVIAWAAAVIKKEPMLLMGQPLTELRVLSHLAFVQELLGFVNINDVYWTLCLEVQFYLLFCGLMGLVQWLEKSKNIRFAQVWVFAPLTAIATLFPLEILSIPGRPTFFLPLWYSFLLGVFAYWAWTKCLNHKLLYAYSAVLFAVGIVKHDEFAIASVITAILLLEVGRAGKMHLWLTAGWMQFLGRISYSVYLTHVPIVGVVFFVGYKVLGVSVLTDGVCLVAGVIASIVTSAVMWQIVEKPAIASSRQIRLTPAVS